MKPETPKDKVKRCQGYVVENGDYRRRWVDEITLHIHGRSPRTLRGGALPDAVVLNTGASQEAKTVLEFFYEKVPLPSGVKVVPVQPAPWPNGRDAAVGVGAILTFQVLLALADVAAKAMSF